MKLRLDGKRKAQLIVVLLGGAALKLYYSAATVNQLRWILAPTTLLVELISRTRFSPPLSRIPCAFPRLFNYVTSPWAAAN